MSNQRQSLTAEEVLRRYSAEDLPEFVELALNDVNQRGNSGSTPLHVAAIRGRLDELEALLHAGATVDIRGENGNTALHEAALQGHAAIVTALVRAGASVALKNADGQTARELALKTRHRDVVKTIDRLGQ